MAAPIGLKRLNSPGAIMVTTRQYPLLLATLVVIALFGNRSTLAQDSTNALMDRELPPAGFGTLRQEDIGIRLQAQSFVVILIPLAEEIIRLLAPDTYRSLHRLLESKAENLAEESRRYGISQPTVFLVSFFATQPHARFDPEALTITGQSRLLRPIAILPLSPSFGDRQVNQRETANAIYLYEDGFSLFDPFEVRYEDISTNQWERFLRIVDRETAAVAARAAAARRDTSVTPRPIQRSAGMPQHL